MKKNNLLFYLFFLILSLHLRGIERSPRRIIKSHAYHFYGKIFLDLIDAIDQENLSNIDKYLIYINPNELIKYEQSSDENSILEPDEKYILLRCNFHEELLRYKYLNKYFRLIHICIERNKLNSLEHLLKHGAKFCGIVNCNTNNEEFSLINHIATQKHPIEFYSRLLEILIKNGFKINTRDNQGKNTILHYATWYSNSALIQSLLNYKNLDLNPYNEQLIIPLHILLLRKENDIKKRIECIKLLLSSKKTNPNIPLPFNNIPLVSCAILNEPEIAKVLISYDQVDLNKTDAQSCSPLMGAIKKESTEIISLLLTKNVDLFHEDCDCKNAFDYAKDKPEILALLHEHVNLKK
ncbi:MAG: ankyrin repeat domain-containing protein [Candidatus Dependentiae bacterium]